MKGYSFILVILLFINLGFSQDNRALRSMVQKSPFDTVTFSSSMPINKALEVLSVISDSTIKKKIVGGEEMTNPIGIEIKSMNWYSALKLIAMYNNCEFIERENYIRFYQKTTPKVDIPQELSGVNFNSRDVNISAIFFELDVKKSREQGINWKWLLSKNDLTIGSQFGNVDNKLFQDVPQTQTTTSTTTTNTQDQTGQNFGLGLKSNFKFLDFMGKAYAIFNFFEGNQLGEIIASPQITVREGQEGYIQVGSDYSTREKDFAGNTVERFFSTGTIIKVKPFVLEENGLKYLAIQLDAERSSAIPGQISTEIKRTKATTKILLLDGEETVIGGLYINEDKTERNGIPFLKDLPWWFFGIRYLTGSDTKVTTKKELIIVLKAKLVPTLQERLAAEKERENLIKKQIEKNNEEIKFYQFAPTTENESTDNENSKNNSVDEGK